MASVLWQNSAIARSDASAEVTQTHCLDTANAEPADIARVTDGDTVVLRDGRRVRLIGINTLELNSVSAQDKEWAFEAKRELERHIRSNQVWLIPGLEKFDRHGRTLAHLRLGDGTSAAEALISQGLGLSITVGSNLRCAQQYEQSEQHARHASLGIWLKPGTWLSIDKKLTSRDRGFHLVASTVAKVIESKKRLTLKLTNGLNVSLNDQYFAASNDTGSPLQNLQGKRVEVRGWLGKVSGKPHLNLSHPTNLRVLSY